MGIHIMSMSSLRSQISTWNRSFPSILTWFSRRSGTKKLRDITYPGMTPPGIRENSSHSGTVPAIPGRLATLLRRTDLIETSQAGGHNKLLNTADRFDLFRFGLCLWSTCIFKSPVECIMHGNYGLKKCKKAAVSSSGPARVFEVDDIGFCDRLRCICNATWMSRSFNVTGVSCTARVCGLKETVEWVEKPQVTRL